MQTLINTPFKKLFYGIYDVESSTTYIGQDGQLYEHLLQDVYITEATDQITFCLDCTTESLNDYSQVKKGKIKTEMEDMDFLQHCINPPSHFSKPA